jgi:hypothetical protein
VSPRTECRGSIDDEREANQRILRMVRGPRRICAWRFWTRTWFLWSGNVLSVIHESSGRSLVLISAAIGNCSWIAHYVVNKLVWKAGCLIQTSLSS